MKFLDRKYLLPICVALLASCGSDQTAQGGTGSDFPIHPAVAVVIEPSGRKVQAAAWRLWKVDSDSMHYARELEATTDGGFQLPQTGSWIVEAWAKVGDAGRGEGLASLPRDAAFERCLNWIGRNRSLSSPPPAILGSCDDLSSPTVLSRGGTQSDPSAIAAFRLPTPEAPTALVMDSTGNALPSRHWRLWRGTSDSSGLFHTFAFSGYQTSGANGSLELEGLVGTWVAEGWTTPPADSLFRTPPRTAALERALLQACLGSTPEVSPRACTEPLFDPALYGSSAGQLPQPDFLLVFRLP